MTEHAAIVAAIGVKQLAEGIAEASKLDWMDNRVRKRCVDRVRQWLLRGKIAADWRLTVAVIALRRGVDLPKGFLPKEFLELAAQHQADPAGKSAPAKLQGAA